MNPLQDKICGANWSAAADHLNDHGYAIIPSLLNNESCDQLINRYDDADLYRKTVQMERYRFGKGEYKYFRYPLPDVIQTIREAVYPYLAPVANSWMDALKNDTTFPLTHNKLIDACRAQQQLLATPLILQYEAGGFNTLHQDLYGEVFFRCRSFLY